MERKEGKLLRKWTERNKGEVVRRRVLRGRRERGSEEEERGSEEVDGEE